MVNGLTRLTVEARGILKELRHDIWVKTKRELSLKDIGSFLIVEASKNTAIINTLIMKGNAKK